MMVPAAAALESETSQLAIDQSGHVCSVEVCTNVLDLVLLNQLANKNYLVFGCLDHSKVRQYDDK